MHMQRFFVDILYYTHGNAILCHVFQIFPSDSNPEVVIKTLLQKQQQNCTTYTNRKRRITATYYGKYTGICGVPSFWGTARMCQQWFPSHFSYSLGTRLVNTQITMPLPLSLCSLTTRVRGELIAPRSSLWEVLGWTTPPWARGPAWSLATDGGVSCPCCVHAGSCPSQTIITGVPTRAWIAPHIGGAL